MKGIILVMSLLFISCTQSRYKNFEQNIETGMVKSRKHTMDWVSCGKYLTYSPDDKYILLSIKISNKDELFLFDRKFDKLILKYHINANYIEDAIFDYNGDIIFQADIPSNVNKSKTLLVKMNKDGLIIQKLLLIDGYIKKINVDYDNNIYFTSYEDGLKKDVLYRYNIRNGLIATNLLAYMDWGIPNNILFINNNEIIYTYDSIGMEESGSLAYYNFINKRFLNIDLTNNGNIVRKSYDNNSILIMQLIKNKNTEYYERWIVKYNINNNIVNNLIEITNDCHFIHNITLSKNKKILLFKTIHRLSFTVETNAFWEINIDGTGLRRIPIDFNTLNLIKTVDVNVR